MPTPLRDADEFPVHCPMCLRPILECRCSVNKRIVEDGLEIVRRVFYVLLNVEKFRDGCSAVALHKVWRVLFGIADSHGVVGFFCHIFYFSFGRFALNKSLQETPIARPPCSRAPLVRRS